MTDEVGSFSAHKCAPTKYAKLNVGGSLFHTTISNLVKQDSMLRAMFSGRMEVLTDSEGWVLIDRSGKHFGLILQYLRDGKVVLPDSVQEVNEILYEARYYLLDDLQQQCQSWLRRTVSNLVRCRTVPLLTSAREEDLLSYTDLPVIKLTVNRYNNVYSYTGQSDDHFLRHIELYNTLSIKFHGRLLFVKYVHGNNEICCWSFYAKGRKVSEISCTSITYTAEKKQTKVEFPEARIYEETLNVLLYEPRTVPEEESWPSNQDNFTLDYEGC